MPSALEISGVGFIDLGEMQTKTVKEIEELYLHLIELNEKITQLEIQNIELRKMVSKRK